MVALEQIQSSNSNIATSYPAGVVAVFAGATAGIGETSLREFARHAMKPRIYIVGRSEEACLRLDTELRALNPEGTYTFLRSDTSLLRNVDDLCVQIKHKEERLNVLFMSQGTANWNKSTDEGLNYLAAVCYFGRLRMIANLLPLLEQGVGLRRVVSSWTASHEGPVYEGNWVAGNTKILVPPWAARGHGTSMMTMALQQFAKMSPTVSFIHNFPGAVRTNLIRPEDGLVLLFSKHFFRVLNFFRYLPETPIKECGERHLFYCTSAKYPPRQGQGAEGVTLPDGILVARGVDGLIGSGAYSLNGAGDSADEAVEGLLNKYAKDGTADRLWAYTEGEFIRIRGNSAI